MIVIKNTIEIKKISEINISNFYLGNLLKKNHYKSNQCIYKVIFIRKKHEYIFKRIYDLQLLGYIVIIMYPERLMCINNDIREINKFLKASCFFALDAKSLNGCYGRRIKNTATILFNKRIYSFIIKNNISDDILNNKIKKLIGEKDFLIKNLKKITNNEVIDPLYIRIRKKTFKYKLKYIFKLIQKYL